MDLENAAPGPFAKPEARTNWETQRDRVLERLETLEERLNRVQEIARSNGLYESKISELAEDKLRRDESELTRERDAFLEAERGIENRRDLAWQPMPAGINRRTPTLDGRLMNPLKRPYSSAKALRIRLGRVVRSPTGLTRAANIGQNQPCDRGSRHSRGSKGD
jgi:hypothetical protein